MSKIHIAILDDHQSSIDGYIYRLSMNEDIQVLATGTYGKMLEPMLSAHPIDLLLLDLSLPVSASNPNPFPVLTVLPEFISRYPDLKIIVISMFAQPALIKALVKIGIQGYILKDDSESILNLAQIVSLVCSNGMYFSKKINLQLFEDADQALLTQRQVEALSLCKAYPDATTHVLAEKLGISNSTFRNLLSGAYGRLGVSTRAAALARAQQLGILAVRTDPDMDIGLD